ncbi:MAG: recombinase family protein [Methanobrevibacter sp.]|nr:recombinase family protein [Methanobrevibacter sp.]
MNKVILFSRVSTLGQDLTQQNDELYAEAKRNGYDEKNIILIEQKESAIKLDEDERIGIQQLKDAITKENVECVIIYEISRLARRPTVLYSVRDFLIDHQVNLICMKPYMRLLDPDGKMSQTASILFSLFGALSESEMMIKKERMMRGRLAKREQLKYIGGNVQFGYTWDKENDKIYINEDERDTVVEIFERYANGESKRQIAKDLIDRGQLRYDNYSTACVMLGRMIRRPEYAGIKGDTYPYPAIISQELYYKVRTRAESRNNYRVRIQGLYYLQGLIHWKMNGMLMSPYKLGVQYRAWDENTNSGTMINMDYIESLVWHFVVEYKKRISGPEKLQMVKSLVDEMMHNNQRHQKAIEEHMSIEKTIERINERVVKGKMSDSQGDRLIEEQQIRLKELDNMMLKYEEDRKQLQAQLNNLQNNIEDYNNVNEEQKNRIIRECVKRVDIEKDGITSVGKYIDIYMIDGTKHSIHMSKKGNNFITKVIYKDEERPLDDLQITVRFIRKKY